MTSRFEVRPTGQDTAGVFDTVADSWYRRFADREFAEAMSSALNETNSGAGYARHLIDHHRLTVEEIATARVTGDRADTSSLHFRRYTNCGWEPGQCATIPHAWTCITAVPGPEGIYRCKWCSEKVTGAEIGIGPVLRITMHVVYELDKAQQATWAAEYGNGDAPEQVTADVKSYFGEAVRNQGTPGFDILGEPTSVS